MTSGVSVREADVSDVDVVVPLFNGYLDFYEHPRDPSEVRAYLAARIANRESVVLLAEDRGLDGAAVGFAQCYPTWASLELAPAWVLHDLFVHPDARGHGVGRTLLRAVAERARAAGATTAVLETAHTNTAAQALYEGEGWVRDTTYRTYSLQL